MDAQDEDARSPLASTLAQRIIEAVGELEKENYQTMDTLRRAITTGLLAVLGGNALSLEWWERHIHH